MNEKKPVRVFGNWIDVSICLNDRVNGKSTFHIEWENKTHLLEVIDHHGKYVCLLWKINPDDKDDLTCEDATEGTLGKAMLAFQIHLERFNPKKVFRINPQIGTSKHSVSFHDGVKTHKDGSQFFDMRIFKNKKAKEAFVKELIADGYKEQSFSLDELEQVPQPLPVVGMKMTKR